MTQVYKGNDVVPVTLIESGPNFVTQIKTKDKDSYSAIQVGFGFRKEKSIKKPQRGHLAKIPNPKSQIPNKSQITNLRWLKEFRVDSTELKAGDEIKISDFNVGDKVTVVAISKGKGFQGVVKRHGFHGGPKSHGQKDRHRAPGSIGASWPQHVIKGMKMAGRMGGDRVTVKNLEVVEVDSENNLIALKGAVPGRKGTLVVIKSS
ncbi:MAG: 50S ribosomal protein L3 [Candidatus Azambacteria bacterium GW2011_GWA2_42_9]|nr:MAG: 50S ribosomal protein L3 [Candidatus Azambacteria bacterium GW2011_GWB1_42_17]KKS45553.1 MAG: 50S ribosomal protein L3 [Candidatus Azambacteria bacterium GW2011_GWA1_42_19]KKS75269.1 MAG: 50S ribosomal protein L3 [Candidatus Azambacteria bacterium GW2011_GWA2_42_9]KKS87791.1 MAG: 50S ribosomal protein L3, large subunit ribosomal protein L3 [Parcubacteria group bacterium GW2011_GWC1_43_11]